MERYIKRCFFVALVAIITMGCNKEICSSEYGCVTLSINNNASLFAKSSLTEAPDTFAVYATDLMNNMVPELSGKYDMLKHREIAIPVGTYTISAQNITEELAEEERGAQRFFGSYTLTIGEGSSNDVSFTCAMANARVSFTFDESFKNIFDTENGDFPAKISASTATNPDRVIEYNSSATLAEDDPQIAYFNVDPNNAVLNFTISARRKNDSAEKSFTKSVELQPQSWYRITIKAASASDPDDVTVNANTAMPLAAN